MKNKDIDLIISKKENAEAYKQGMTDLQEEIKEIDKKISLVMYTEEKEMLIKEKQQKEEELINLKSTYKDKRENVIREIEDYKDELVNEIEEFKSRLISKREADKLKKEKEEKEIELEECEKDINETKNKLRALIDEDGGYEQDTQSVSKKFDGLTAYRTYIKESLDEINTKLENKLIIEEYMEEAKYVDYMKMRLSNLSYDFLEQWKENEEKILKDTEYEKEQKIQEQTKPEPEPTEPESTEPEPTEPEPTEPEPTKPEPTKPEPTKPEPTKPEPTKPEPTKPEPTKPEPTKPEPAKPEPTPPPTPHKSKKEITEIIINPLENKIDYYFNDSQYNIKGWKNEDDTLCLSYDKSRIKNIISILENIGEKGDLSDIAEMIDPNIVEFLVRNSKKFNIQIDDYLNMLRGKEANFNIKYDLRDIYNSDLDYKQIKNINKIAKLANIKTNGAVSYKRDNFLNRAFGSIKKRIEYISKKMITSGKKEKKEEINNHNPKDSILGKAKDKTKEKLNDTKLDNVKYFTSRKLPRTTRIAKEALGALNIAGAKIYGYFKGENPLVTKNRIKNIRAKSFVPKVKVDEREAVKKVQASQEEPEKREVIVENPDETKTTGILLDSIDDENTK